MGGAAEVHRLGGFRGLSFRLEVFLGFRALGRSRSRFPFERALGVLEGWPCSTGGSAGGSFFNHERIGHARAWVQEAVVFGLLTWTPAAAAQTPEEKTK